MLLEKYIVVVNLVDNKALGVYYKKWCAFIHILIVVAFSYEEVTGECFLVLTFLSTEIDTCIAQTHTHNFLPS